MVAREGIFTQLTPRIIILSAARQTISGSGVEAIMLSWLRKREELDASAHLFDFVVWVDRSEHEPPEPNGSMELTAADADIFLDNNGNLDALEAQVLELLTG
jgi:hypothetical protein